MKPVSPAAKDVSLKILAVVLAIAIWAVAITDKQTASPDSKIEVVVQAPVALKNIPDDLLVTEPPAAVTVRLRGPRGLESAALESTAAVVDLEKAGPGENLFPVEVVPPDGFEMVRMSRAVVDLSLERRVVISCPVKVGLVTAPHLDLELGQGLAGALLLFSEDEACDGAHATPDILEEGGVAASQDVAEEESGLIEPSDVDVGPAAGQVTNLNGEPNSGRPKRVDLPDLSVSISVLPGEVSVAGADSVVSKVASVVALVTVGPESSMVAPVLTLDVHGEPVPDVTVYPDTVTVSITY
ncbi:MAG: hypothetical protein PHP20_02710 [Firmicutes bacterium]|nr:hypothetical protein [Bacillota bacterium]